MHDPVNKLESIKLSFIYDEYMYSTSDYIARRDVAVRTNIMSIGLDF